MEDDCRWDGGPLGCEMNDLGEGDFGKCTYIGRQRECPNYLKMKYCD
jgi:hypothetical protein